MGPYVLEQRVRLGSTPLSADVTAHDPECLSVSGKLFKSFLAQSPYSLREGAWFARTAISVFSAFDTISSKGITHLRRYSGKAEGEVGSSRGVRINFHLTDSVEDVGRLDTKTAGVESVLNKSPSVRSYADAPKTLPEYASGSVVCVARLSLVGDFEGSSFGPKEERFD